MSRFTENPHEGQFTTLKMRNRVSMHKNISFLHLLGGFSPFAQQIKKQQNATFVVFVLFRSSSAVLHSLTAYGRYLALLDLDQRTLKCPAYSGALINTLADPHVCIRRGTTYLLHLESCLTALANRALLHTFLPAPHPAPAAGGTEERLLRTRTPCSGESDFRVLRFLSDLIKQRHAGRGPVFLGFSHGSSQLHRNTYPT